MAEPKKYTKEHVTLNEWIAEFRRIANEEYEMGLEEGSAYLHPNNWRDAYEYGDTPGEALRLDLSYA